MMTTTTRATTTRALGRTGAARTGAAPTGTAPTSAAAADTAAGGSTRSWAPVWVRPTVPAAFRRATVRAAAVDQEIAPVRLDEATRRLLRVPSLVAETADRLRSRHPVPDTDAPARPSRRRVRRTHTRRPPSGLIRAVPVFAGGGGCEPVPGPSVVSPYRMSRRARLSLTFTVFAAVVVVAATALTSSGPTATAEVTVVAGDTLWSIAQRSAPDDEVWSVIDDISALNGLTGVDVVPGQKLIVPVG